LFVLRTGIAWQQLPQELGYGSGMTCWRRLKEWQQAGVFQALHERLLAQLRAAGRLDLATAVCDSALLRALLGARRPALAPLIGQTRQQTPPDYRRQRHTARLSAHKRQRT
jgi:transposase